ncbi:MAG: OmpA family protein [Bacteroides sp.]|nr:OmpA family protein [Bacteroides sp.]
MKSKLVILSLLLSGVATFADAQTKEKYYSESWKDNWFLSVGVGAQAGTNPDSDFGKTVAPLINVSLGKYISPVWGIRGQVYGWQSKQKTAYPFLDQETVVSRTKRKENYIGLNADAILNLSNLFGGYKEDRKFEFTLFGGPSVNVVKNYGTWQLGYKTDDGVTNADGSVTYTTTVDPSTTKPVNHSLRWLVGASVGLGAKYNINEFWALDLELRGQVTPSILGAYSSADTDGYLYLSIGGTYTFGGKKFVSCSAKVDQAAINNEVNKYRSELAQAQTDLANTKNALSNAKQEVKEVVKEVQVAGPRAIFFKIGSSKIDDYGKVNIQLAAKVLKANPDKKYKIAGYADKATGSSSTNQKLSEKRAQAVYDAFIAEGVDASQLELVGFGGTENMFGKDYLNRVVILE